MLPSERPATRLRRRGVARSHVPGHSFDRRFAAGEAPIFTYRRFAQTAVLSPTLSLLPPSFNQNL